MLRQSTRQSDKFASSKIIFSCTCISKKLILCLSLVFVFSINFSHSSNTYAAKISKVVKRGKKVKISKAGDFSMGDVVYAFRGRNPVAKMQIYKIKGRTAYAKVLEGKVQKGLKVNYSSQLYKTGRGSIGIKSGPRAGLGFLIGSGSDSLPITLTVDYLYLLHPSFKNMVFHAGFSYTSLSQKYTSFAGEATLGTTVTNISGGLGYVFKFKKKMHVDVGARIGYAMVETNYSDNSASNASGGLINITPFALLNYRLKKKIHLGAEVRYPFYLDSEYSLSGIIMTANAQYMF